MTSGTVIIFCHRGFYWLLNKPIACLWGEKVLKAWEGSEWKLELYFVKSWVSPTIPSGTQSDTCILSLSIVLCRASIPPTRQDKRVCLLYRQSDILMTGNTHVEQKVQSIRAFPPYQQKLEDILTNTLDIVSIDRIQLYGVSCCLMWNWPLILEAVSGR